MWEEEHSLVLAVVLYFLHVWKPLRDNLRATMSGCPLTNPENAYSRSYAILLVVAHLLGAEIRRTYFGWSAFEYSYHRTHDQIDIGVYDQDCLDCKLDSW